MDDGTVRSIDPLRSKDVTSDGQGKVSVLRNETFNTDERQERGRESKESFIGR